MERRCLPAGLAPSCHHSAAAKLRISAGADAWREATLDYGTSEVVVILEGLTGTGKTSTIQALQRIATFEWIDETATFGDFVTESLADRDRAARDASDRMSRILTLPEDRLESRSFRRVEYEGEDWQNLVALHGSEDSALDALRRAQTARALAIRSSGLPYLTIDTSERAWERYAREIAAWAGWSSGQGAESALEVGN